MTQAILEQTTKSTSSDRNKPFVIEPVLNVEAFLATLPEFSNEEVAKLETAISTDRVARRASTQQ